MISLLRVFIAIFICNILWVLGLRGSAQSHPNTEPWVRYSFKLPNDLGNANLDTRAAHPFLNEHQYWISGTCLGQPFSVEPSMQSGGSPDLILEFIARQREGGPFLAITHSSKQYPGERLEFIDLETGMLYGHDQGDKSINDWLKNLKRTPIGFLDSHADFHLTDGSFQNHKVAPESTSEALRRKAILRNPSDKTMRGIFAVHEAELVMLAHMMAKEKRVCEVDVSGRATDKSYQDVHISKEKTLQYISLLEKVKAHSIERKLESADVTIRISEYPLDKKSFCYAAKGIPQYKCVSKPGSHRYPLVADTEIGDNKLNDLHQSSKLEKNWYILRDHEIWKN